MKECKQLAEEEVHTDMTLLVALEREGAKMSAMTNVFLLFGVRYMAPAGERMCFIRDFLFFMSAIYM